MNLAVVRELRRVKRLRADRAEEELRRRRAALAAATEAAAEAARVLTEWRAEMPRQQATIYATVIGRVVDAEALATVKARINALRDHEVLLRERLEEAQKGVQTAETDVRIALANSQEARRTLAKFDDLVTALQRNEALLAERREDSELEEAVEGRDGADNGLDDDEFSAAAGGDDERYQAY
jgi:type III secretion protein O